MPSDLPEKLKDKGYRDAFVASQIMIALPFQMRALREQRGLTQAQLAEKAGMLQPRISAMERPGVSKFNLETVLRIASALDIAFIGRFATFGELVGWVENFSPDTFVVPSFDDDPRVHESIAASTQLSVAINAQEVLSEEIPNPLKNKALGIGENQSVDPRKEIAKFLIATNTDSRKIIRLPKSVTDIPHHEEVRHAAVGNLPS
jgi:transcriptional regulator with XRE-family HTH domain